MTLTLGRLMKLRPTKMTVYKQKIQLTKKVFWRFFFPCPFFLISINAGFDFLRTLYKYRLFPYFSFRQLIGQSFFHIAASNFNNFFFISIPSRNPANVPFLRMTRWQGMMIKAGFCPIAVPTARTALGLPILSAIS